MRGAAALLAVALLASGGVAQAQDVPIGSHLPLQRNGSALAPNGYTGIAKDDVVARGAAHDWAVCFNLRYPGAVKRILNEQTPEQAERTTGKLGNDMTCMNGTHAYTPMAESQAIAMPTDILRGMLAEAAVLSDRAPVSPPPLPIEHRYERPWFALTTRASAIDAMAACVADTNPSGVRALLHSDLATNAEGAAFGSLMPSLGPCLQVGAKLNANRQALRAALAEALFHRMYPVDTAAPAAAAEARK